MDFRRRIIAPCLREDGTLDVGEFLLNLLLFDTYIIRAPTLLELPPMVQLFGLDPVITALSSDAVRLDFLTFSIANRPGGSAMQFSPVAVKAHSPPGMLDYHINSVLSKMPSLTLGERRRLDDAIRKAAILPPQNFGGAT